MTIFNHMKKKNKRTVNGTTATIPTPAKNHRPITIPGAIPNGPSLQKQNHNPEKQSHQGNAELKQSPRSSLTKPTPKKDAPKKILGANPNDPPLQTDVHDPEKQTHQVDEEVKASTTNDWGNNNGGETRQVTSSSKLKRQTLRRNRTWSVQNQHTHNHQSTEKNDPLSENTSLQQDVSESDETTVSDPLNMNDSSQQYLQKSPKVHSDLNEKQYAESDADETDNSSQSLENDQIIQEYNRTEYLQRLSTHVNLGETANNSSELTADIEVSGSEEQQSSIQNTSLTKQFSSDKNVDASDIGKQSNPNKVCADKVLENTTDPALFGADKVLENTTDPALFDNTYPNCVWKTLWDTLGNKKQGHLRVFFILNNPNKDEYANDSSKYDKGKNENAFINGLKDTRNHLPFTKIYTGLNEWDIKMAANIKNGTSVDFSVLGCATFSTDKITPETWNFVVEKVAALPSCKLPDINGPLEPNAKIIKRIQSENRKHMDDQMKQLISCISIPEQGVTDSPVALVGNRSLLDKIEVYSSRRAVSKTGDEEVHLLNF
eukprot:GHVT01104973.1.p1 GENE.GHVT01104973.1~~GHVT01104973.1.p1  ORF type:complete len:546 (-),score=44.75 GHVT01104973.1:360-1997(-)